MQHVYLPENVLRRRRLSNPCKRGAIPRKGEMQGGLARARQAGFGQRPAAPGELLAVPAGQRRHGDALARRVDHPAGAQVDPGVADRARARARAGRTEEEHVARGDPRERDPLCLRHLAAHLVGRAALDRRRKRCYAGVGLKLVDTPDEAGAVEAAGRLDAERRRGLLARAAPDVREADEPDRRVQHALLPGAELGELERRGRLLDGLLLPTAEAQDPRDRVGGLCARHGLGGKELEVVLPGGVVRAQAEQPGDRLGAEARRGDEARRSAAVAERLRCVPQTEDADEARVELRDRNRGGRVGGDGRRLLRQARDEPRELALRERVVRAERRLRLGHQTTADDVPDLGLRPRRRGRVRGFRAPAGAAEVAARAGEGGRHGEQGAAEEDGGERAAHPPFVSSRRRLAFRLRPVDVQIRPEPEERDAILAAVEALLKRDPAPAAYTSGWRTRGVRENVDEAYGEAVRPRSRPGATRA